MYMYFTFTNALSYTVYFYILTTRQDVGLIMTLWLVRTQHVI